MIINTKEGLKVWSRLLLDSGVEYTLEIAKDEFGEFVISKNPRFNNHVIYRNRGGICCYITPEQVGSLSCISATGRYLTITIK